MRELHSATCKAAWANSRAIWIALWLLIRIKRGVSSHRIRATSTRPAPIPMQPAFAKNCNAVEREAVRTRPTMETSFLRPHGRQRWMRAMLRPRPMHSGSTMRPGTRRRAFSFLNFLSLPTRGYTVAVLAGLRATWMQLVERRKHRACWISYSVMRFRVRPPERQSPGKGDYARRFQRVA